MPEPTPSKKKAVKPAAGSDRSGDLSSKDLRTLRAIAKDPEFTRTLKAGLEDFKAGRGQVYEANERPKSA